MNLAILGSTNEVGGRAKLINSMILVAKSTAIHLHLYTEVKTVE